MKQALIVIARGCARTAVVLLLAALIVPASALGPAAFAVSISAADAAAKASAVTGARVSQDADRTRVVLELSEPVTFRHFVLRNPCRIVFDLAEVDWQLPVDQFAIESPSLKALRYGLFRPGTSRVVLDCKVPVAVDHARMIAGRSGQGQRLVIDLVRVAEADPAAAAGSPAQPSAADPVTWAAAPPARATKPPAADPGGARAETPAPGIVAPEPETAPRPKSGTGVAVDAVEPNVATTSATAMGAATAPTAGRAVRPLAPSVEATPVVFRLPPQKPLRWTSQKVVVIDPGHGGGDPGAISVSGVYEKRVTLKAARILRRELQRHGRYRVVMTRDGDRMVRLRERIRIARQARADLFISIHADANPVSWVRGASVYTLSEQASDAEAAALAERENKADLINGVDLSGEEPEVATILIDLARRETMNESARLASAVVHELGRSTSLLRNTHRFAGFAVLKAPDVPSVLVEIGLLSNRDDERLLQRDEYLTKLAQAIVDATDLYFDGIKEARLQ